MVTISPQGDQKKEEKENSPPSLGQKNNRKQAATSFSHGVKDFWST